MKEIGYFNPLCYMRQTWRPAFMISNITVTAATYWFVWWAQSGTSPQSTVLRSFDFMWQTFNNKYVVKHKSAKLL